MNRKVIVLIVLCALIMLSSCGSARGINGVNGTNYASAIFNDKKCLEIYNKLYPRQYEGFSDSTMITIIAGESIDTIPEWCFSRIPLLNEFIIRGKNVVIEPNAFYACKNLQKVNLNNVIKCGENAFKMTAVDSVCMIRCEYIEDFAFANCNFLHCVSFSDSLRHIGDFAFSSDTALVEINIPNGIIGSCCFMGCSNLQNVTLGNVSVIGESAFLNCTSLHEITIPETVVEIKDGAFSGCTNLKVVKVLNRRTIIANNAFDNGKIIRYLNLRAI